MQCELHKELTVPVHFSQRTRLDGEMRCRHCLGEREVGRVSDANLTSRRIHWLLVEHLVRELQLRLLVAGATARDLLFDAVRVRALKNVLFFLWDSTEDFRRDTEVLSQNGLGCARDPVGEQEG